MRRVRREGKKKKEKGAHTGSTKGIGPIGEHTGSNQRGTLLIPGDLPWGFLRSWSELGVALRLPVRFDLSWPASHATAITHRPLISIFQPLLALLPLPSTISLSYVNHTWFLRSKSRSSFFDCFRVHLEIDRLIAPLGEVSCEVVLLDRSRADSMEPV